MRKGTVQPGEVRTEVDIISLYKYLKGGCMKEGARPVTGPEAMGTNKHRITNITKHSL